MCFYQFKFNKKNCSGVGNVDLLFSILRLKIKKSKNTNKIKIWKTIIFYFFGQGLNIILKSVIRYCKQCCNCTMVFYKEDI